MEVSVNNLQKGFGGEAVIKAVSLTVKEGERVAVIGPNGSGKTTLLRLLNLMIFPDQGSIELAGKKVTGLGVREARTVRRGIATVYQSHNLIPRFKVINNVLSGKLGSWSTSKALFSLLIKPLEEVGVREVLEMTGIEDKIYWRTDRLSGGQQQRVAIARALFQDPNLLLADEPFASLDPRSGEKLIEILVGWSKQKNKTLIVTLHHLEFALANFPRIIALKNGTIFFDLPTGQVTPERLQQLYGDDHQGA
ncbi:MAG: phosphonate ABC transporter ATP-binding protein [Gammaproteobacteria bacterium]|nr:phosphonate ABC transporter ATP-binding protein [Gammaproteobacteria bacterium]